MAPPLPGNAPLVLGPPLVGATLNWFFYGVLVVQYFLYLDNSHKDKMWLRAVVHFLFFLDTAQSILIARDMFSWYVYNFGGSEVFFELSVLGIDGPLLDSMIILTAQLVYCWRLWVLGGWKTLPGVTAVLAFISGITGTCVGLIVQIDGAESDQFNSVQELRLFSGVAADILIACSMAYLVCLELSFRQDLCGSSGLSFLEAPKIPEAKIIPDNYAYDKTNSDTNIGDECPDQ
ncbi:hypothetical protein D9756_010917 [Leucocoprinus leucothites]|uniref:Uncharacterized protein n=1 Tax=Leucocoprinus leucothites TaxID=201217 RepID=A0A8H5FRC2_9AGAR|nr:hypothetical protein D9756_010917 [Leucoagaricus leucothites]